MDQHKTAAADIAGARIAHRERKSDRDRGVDRIAALFQNVDADARRQRLLRHHHAVARDDALRMADRGIQTAFGAREQRQGKKAGECEGREPEDWMSAHSAN